MFCPGRVRAGDGAGHGGDVGGERAGVGDLFEAQPVEASDEVPEGGEAVQQAGGEGVSGADGVDDVDGRGRDGDAVAVEGSECAASAEGDDDESCAGGVPGVASLFKAGTGEEQREVVLAEAEDVGEGAPARKPLLVGRGRYEQGADVGVDGYGDVLAGSGEVLLDVAGAGLAYQGQGSGVQADRVVLLGGGEFVGGAVGLEGVGGLAARGRSRCRSNRRRSR